jgi:isoleucyl-tRNA synthetase
MKASLSTREPLILERWVKDDVYGSICSKQRDKEKFVLHDGPPYANGEIHLGQALNKILKDIVVKYKAMRGFLAPFVPGWDCHGLPVEHQLFKELKIGKHKIGRTEFRKKARDYALKYVAIQKEQFKRLGVFGDWDNPYLTLDPSYQSTIVECFGKLYLDGYIYRGLKPIHWCAACETALAEAEVEYGDRTSPSIFVGFPVRSGLEKAFPNVKEAAFLIWTTTPWTLPANMAVAVRPEFEYVAVEVKGRTLILARELLDGVANELGEDKYRILGSCKGGALEGVITAHPFVERESPVVLSPHVTLEQGSGCVHIAPGHGEEDYRIGRAYGLEVYAPVNEKGEFTKDAGRFEGIKVEKANAGIIDLLNERGSLVSMREIVHSYPHCWRCHKPVIFRATTQWFMGVDRKDLRKRAIELIGSVRWIPERSRNRIGSMLEQRPDWCLSRQRYWGVPIPMMYCAKCGEPFMSEDVLGRIRDAVAERSADVWFEEEAAFFLPDGTVCPACGSAEFRKEEDIIDVWFDSGISHQAVLAKRPELGSPSALYLEGSDQHRGWFQTSLLTSVALKGPAPFASVLTHGFVTDGEGKKMSKSAGNVIAPRGVMERYGADILRLWVASVDYAVDMRISEEIIEKLVDAYRRIRNTFRFILGNLCDFSPERDAVPRDRMMEIDRWILSRTQRFSSEVTAAYERYDFCGAYHRLHNFCAVELSSLYLDVIKDRLYTSGAGSAERRSAQTAICGIFEALVKLSAPILAFTAEEAWQARPQAGDRQASVHLADWPASDEELMDESLDAEWERLLEVRKEVSKALEVARQGNMVGNALEAEVTIACADEDELRFLQNKRGLLADLFIVSQVVLEKAAATGGARAREARVARAKGVKCARCWKYSVSVGDSEDHPAICRRCVQVVEERDR